MPHTDICSEEDAGFRFAEAKKGFCSLGLRQIAMQTIQRDINQWRTF
jgi:hypothetical protein